MRFLWLFLCWLTLPLDAEIRVPSTLSEVQLSFAPLVRQAAPAVVNIYARRVVAQRQNPFGADPFFRDFFSDFGQLKPRVQNSLGSGVILSADGIVVSNYHVVGQATDIRVVLQDRREFAAQVLLADEESDLAILQLQGAGDMPFLPLRSSDTVEVGELVLAIGNPYGVGQTVTQGIVSATGRNGLGLNTFENFIQTDADINPGNSGGALVDSYGNLLGINTAILNQAGSAGIGFAIPADTAEKVLNDIISYGYVVRGWLGMDAFPLTQPIAKRLNLPIYQGLLVRAIYNGSPAFLVGIQPGDIVIKINGEPVTDRQTSISQIADVAPGAPIELEIWRQGATFAVTAVAGIRPTSPG